MKIIEYLAVAVIPWTTKETAGKVNDDRKLASYSLSVIPLAKEDMSISDVAYSETKNFGFARQCSHLQRLAKWTKASSSHPFGAHSREATHCLISKASGE
jgi:hypothetical protein